MEKLPKTISPNPIIEAVIELRYEANVPSEALFGLLYTNEIKTIFPKYDSLPILQIPEAIRKEDINLKYAPYYKFTGENISLNFGPKVISIINNEAYGGWKQYYSVVSTIINHLEIKGYIKKIERIGVRYINFFEEPDIFSNLSFSIENFPFESTNAKSFSVKLKNTNEIFSNLQIISDAQVNLGNKYLVGSIIDIDTYYEKTIVFSKDEISRFINIEHDELKKIFFNTLSPAFIGKTFEVVS